MASQKGQASSSKTGEVSVNLDKLSTALQEAIADWLLGEGVRDGCEAARREPPCLIAEAEGQPLGVRAKQVVLAQTVDATATDTGTGEERADRKSVV